ncbi:MAG: NADH-quinone oxidoreductase subunit L [Verrucomicrobia bacterium]|nr:NADH-quinone oxidoreductase subunit L [Verrucomicrobiota bacterium]MDA1006126.1 NADH-quinone oxidoreductase subunit L [Verrucomicrobiota bacterium]
MNEAWLLLILPLAAAVLIQLRLKRIPALAAAVSVLSVVLTFLLSLIFAASDTVDEAVFTWAAAGDFTIKIGLQLDKLSKGMMIIVTGVGALVHIFSLAYMKDDEAKARYFCGLSIFMFSMTGIVLANNFVMMFIFWELVGFSSYLLIGHWYQKDSAAEAAKKAFLVNRIGDFGFLIGILMLWGLAGSLVFDQMALPAQGPLLTAAVLLVFCGALGKSAQFPLHVWLPDAMEGPTPVSALIHAATMVAAGVYMLFRLQFSFVDAEGIRQGWQLFANHSGEIIAWIGGITALLAALMATQQDDIKKILAYSTLSQLGYMIMAIGLAGHTETGHANLAGESGMFHLYTHAWFKALLFLGSGAIIYACHHEQNIWKMGGLAKRMKATTLTFVIGTAALMAVPFLTSGFYSKEEILLATLGHDGGMTPLFFVAAFVAFLTPFYMTRLLVVTFLGKPRSHGAEEAKEVGGLMLVPLVILAALAIASAFVIEGIGINIPAMFSAIDPRSHGHHPDSAVTALVLGTSFAALFAGVGLGYFLYKDRETDPLENNDLFQVFRNKFYIDELYLKIVRIGQDCVAAIIHFFDEFIINGLLVGGLSRSVGGLGNLFRRMQSGNLQIYALLFGGGILLVVYLTVFFTS